MIPGVPREQRGTPWRARAPPATLGELRRSVLSGRRGSARGPCRGPAVTAGQVGHAYAQAIEAATARPRVWCGEVVEGGGELRVVAQSAEQAADLARARGFALASDDFFERGLAGVDEIDGSATLRRIDEDGDETTQVIA